MLDMFSTSRPMTRTTPETITVSKCCGSSVTTCTPDDYAKLDQADKDSLVMTLQFICNKCGAFCSVEEKEI